MFITASKLYDYTRCPHKVWRDAHGPQEEKSEEPNPFVKLLWDRGIAHEEKVVKRVGDYVDISKGSHDQRFIRTIDEMKKGSPLIYQGVLREGNLLGIPDLLERLPDGSYVPVDIKSGMAFSGTSNGSDEESKPKEHYAVQLCLYNELLKRLKFASHDMGRIIDARLEKVTYELLSKRGARSNTTWWEHYEGIKNHVDRLLKNEDRNNPAKSGVCKLCEWYESCKKWCERENDPTNIFYLGRSVRDRLTKELNIEKIQDLVSIDVGELLERKKGDKSFLKGIGESTLCSAMRRARIITETKEPVSYGKIEFPKVARELFFDIEDDPTQEFVYMHGIYERSNEGEKYIHFTAREVSEQAEKKAWIDFWSYIGSISKESFSVYYFSAHEKSTYRRLRRKYPDVISEEKLEEFFDNPNVIDLYLHVVLKKTDWPLSSYSLKELASYLGFKWRDETPSGALSIQWFNEYVDKRDPKMLERILLYNEDDCRATMVLKDGIDKLKVV